MSTTLRIPKQSDREIAIALGRVRDSFKDLRRVTIHAHPPHMGGVPMESEKPEEAPNLQFIFELHARTISTFQLVDESGQAAVNLYRKHAEIFDEATITDDWIRHVPDAKKTAATIRLHGLLQKHLRVDDLDAALSGGGDSAWNRFRDAQLGVLSSLEQTSQRLLVDTAKQIEFARSSEAQKNEELRLQLKRDFDAQQTLLTSEHDQKLKALAAREEALAKQLADFETKESKYVARQEAKKQLDQLKEWLKDSSLTDKTVRKRRPVVIGYVVAILATGALT